MHLSDMEELLSRIHNRAVVGYMREALGCYNAGSYRACIILSTIAVFDDMDQKLQELEKINTPAKEIVTKVQERKEDQKVFETYMVDQLKNKKNNLITTSQASTLKQLCIFRNKAAHPSGHYASAEEARFVFFEAIDKFLSELLLFTNSAADALIVRLGNNNFFPTNNINEVTNIVAEELENLHNSVFPYLINKLINLCTNNSKNHQLFLTGLSFLKKDELTDLLCNHLIKKKVEDFEFKDVIFRVISANAAVLDGLDETTILRLKNLLEKAVNDVKSTLPINSFRHPVMLFRSMLETLGGEKILENFETLIHKIIEKYFYTGMMIEKIGLIPKLKTSWLEKLKSEAGSDIFSIANSFAERIPEIDQIVSDQIDDRDAFELIVEVCVAADIGAHKSAGLRLNNFSALPHLKKKALNYINNAPKNAEEAIAEKELAENPHDFIMNFLKESEDV